ncbi:cytochrome P450 [Nocardia sp. NPDC051570]|uniref:cytochrome P450 n=1 Tax=Nocardia sp. NPDC051570 TaxID=3364324 RepID=UPI0037BDC818
MSDTHVPVLIVGGGLTGLSAALCLARLDVGFLLVDRHSTTSSHPKARALNPRTTEVLGALGLAEALTANRSPIAENNQLVHVHSLAGEERIRLPRAPHDEVSFVSSHGWSLIDQNRLEPLLLEQLSEDAGEIRFGTECVSLSQQDDCVRVRLRDRATGTEQEVTADYVIAADGGRSPLRDELGIGVEGPGRLSSMVSYFFRADLKPYLRGRRIIAAYVLNDRFKGTLMPLDNVDRWVFNVSYYPEKGEDAAEFDREWCVQKTRDGIGVPDLEVEVLSDELLPWEIAGRTADRMRSGRVFLAGDAAHVMPPTGAFGASTGIQDVHNLCWKIAHVQHGHASPGLLDTYETERLPVAHLVVSQSMLRFTIRQGSALGDVSDRMLDELAVSFGYRYSMDGESTKGEVRVDDPRERIAEPGCRAPHVMLAGPDGPASLHNLCRYGRFTILVDGHHSASADLAAGLAAWQHPLDAVLIGPGGKHTDPESEWRRVYGLGEGGAVLIRPDGFIAASWPQPPSRADIGRALDTAERFEDEPIGTRFRPFAVDPQDELLAEARETEPVFHSPELDAWIVTRYDDVKAILGNTKAFSLATVPDRLARLTDAAYAELAKTFSEVPVAIREEAVDEARKRVRMPLMNAFDPKRIAEREKRTLAEIDFLIDQFADRGEAELMAEFARQLPVRVKAPVLGIDPADVDEFVDGTYRFMKLHSVAAQLSADEQISLAREVVGYQRLLDRYAQARREVPRDDLFSDLVAAIASGTGALTVAERKAVVDGMTGLIAAGHFTTTAALGTSLLELLRRPPLWQRLVTDPDLAATAADELVRYRSPLRGLMRRTTKTVRVGAVTMPPKTELMISYQSADRDGAVFSDPDEIRLDRGHVEHFGFGHGPRACVGEALGRQLLTLTLRRLAQRLPGLELVPGHEPEYLPGLHVILDSLPVRWPISR